MSKRIIISHIQLDCQGCDIYDPTEGNCSDCLREKSDFEKLVEMQEKDGEQDG